MALFNRKKEPEKKEAPAENPVESLDPTRATLNELIDMLRELNQSAVQEKMYRSVMKNEEDSAKKAEARRQQLEEQKETGNEIFDKTDLEKNLYIMPDEMQSYTNAINGVAQIFSTYSAAETVMTGADKVDIYLKDYILKLRAALEKGQKMKADACMDTLKYAITVAHKAPETTNEADIEKIINARIDFISGICRDLLQTIDSYYGHIKAIEIEERSYRDAYEQFMELDERLQAIPPEDLHLIENLDIGKNLDKIPVGDKRREYLPLLLAERGAATKAMYRNLQLEQNVLSAVALRNDIDELTIEFRKAFNTEGQVFNLAEHQKTMRTMRDKSMADIDKMQKQIEVAHKMDNELQSMINAAATIKATGTNAAENYQNAMTMRNLSKKNEEFTKQINEQAAALQKQKEEQQQAAIENAQQQEETKILAEN